MDAHRNLPFCAKRKKILRYIADRAVEQNGGSVVDVYLTLAAFVCKPHRILFALYF
jgi:hypothetical protein